MSLRTALRVVVLLCLSLVPAAAQNTGVSPTSAAAAGAPTLQAPAPLKAHPKLLTRMIISSDLTLLVTASRDDTVKVWNIPERRLLATLQVPEKHLIEVRLLPDGGRVLTAHSDDKIRLWSPEGQVLATMDGKVSYWQPDIALAPDGKILAVRKGDEILVWSLPDAKLLATIKQEAGDARRLAIAPDGKTLVSAGAGRRASLIKAWSLPDGRFLGKVSGAAQEALVAFGPDAGTLVTVGGVSHGTKPGSKSLFLWSSPQLALVSELNVHEKPISVFSVGPDRKTVATCSTEGKINLWSLSPPGLLDTLPERSKTCVMDFSTDGKWFAFPAEDHSVKLYSLGERRLLASLATQQDMVRSLMITPGKQFLVSAGNDSSLQVWKIPEGRRIADLSGHTGAPIFLLSFVRSEGMLLISGQSGVIESRDLFLSGLAVGLISGGVIGGAVGGIMGGVSEQTVVKEKEGVIALWNLDRLEFCGYLADPKLVKGSGYH